MDLTLLPPLRVLEGRDPCGNQQYSWGVRQSLEENKITQIYFIRKDLLVHGHFTRFVGWDRVVLGGRGLDSTH